MQKISTGFAFSIVIILAVFFGRIFWLMGIRENDNQTLQVASDALPIKIWPDASWQMYRNEQYGFEFKYPQDWFNQTTKANDGIYAFNVYIASKDIKNNYNDLNDDDVTISVVKIKNENELGNDVYLRDLEKFTADEIILSDKKKVFIDGNEGIMMMREVKISDPGCGLETYFKKDEKSYQVSMIGNTCESVKKHEDTYSALLESLKVWK